MKTPAISCLALCLLGSTTWGKNWLFTGAVTTKTDWQAAGTNWSTIFVTIHTPELPFHQLRFIYNPTNGLVDPERCSWLPELSLPPFTNQLTEAQLPRLKCPARISALVTAAFKSRCRLTFAADRWDPDTQRSGEIALKNLEWMPDDAWSQDTTWRPYLAYWLTNAPLGDYVSEYVNLILTRTPLAELPALSQPTNQPILESDAIIAVTYARDSLWNFDLRPFKPLIGVETVGTNFIVIQGKRFACVEADLKEVLHLLRNPMGKIRIHVINPGAAGQEQEVRALAGRLEQQLAGKGMNPPTAPPVTRLASTNAHTKTIPQEIFEQIGRQLPKLNCLGTSSGTSSSNEVWKGEEYATAHYGNESDAFALSITIHRYASTGAAQEDLKKGFGMRPALPPPPETYKGARLHRYASGGNVICQFNQYIIEVIPAPRSGITQSQVMKALDAALAGLGN